MFPSFLSKAILVLPLMLIPLSVSGFFYGFFTTLKWQEIYVSALLGAFILVCRDHFFVPVFSQKINYLIIGLLGILFLNYFLHDVHFISAVSLNRLTFIFIVLCSYSIFKFDDALFDTISCVISFSFLVYFGVYLFWIFHNELVFFRDEEVRAFTFGNVNMTAQFVGISFLFSIYNIFYQPNRYIKFISLFASVACFGLLLFLNCRSIAVALALSIPLIVLYKDGKRKISHSIIAFSLGLVLLFGNSTSKELTPNYDEISESEISKRKGLSIWHRVGLWQATLKMAADHPFGIGGGKFQFYIMPYKTENKILQKMKQDMELPNYHEDYLERTPHNDYLMVLSEDGIIVFILGLLICCILLFQVRRKNFFEKPFNVLFLSYGVFIAVESFFQFPFSTAYPFFVTAIMIGGGLQQFFSEKGLKLKPLMIWPSFLVCGLIYGASTYGQYVMSSNRDSENLTAFACKMMPMNWKICTSAAHNCMLNGDTDKAELILQSQCDLFPHNFLAQRALLSVYHSKEDLASFCSVIRSYDGLFQAKSSYHEGVSFCDQAERG